MSDAVIKAFIVLFLGVIAFGILFLYNAYGSDACAMWARDIVEIEVRTGTAYDLVYVKDELLFQASEDVDLKTADENLVLIRLGTHVKACKALGEGYVPPLPNVPMAHTKRWAQRTAALAIGRQGVAPADTGDEEWKRQCRAEYNTWDEETGTVIRRGNPNRVRCPCGGEVICGR